MLSSLRSGLFTRTLTHATEHLDAIPDVPTHEEKLNATQYPEPSVAIPLPTTDLPATSLTLAEARLKVKLDPTWLSHRIPTRSLSFKNWTHPSPAVRRQCGESELAPQLEAPALTAYSALEGADLSSLNELSEDDGENMHLKKKIEKAKKPRATQPGQVALQDGKLLEGGTLGKYLTADFRI